MRLGRARPRQPAAAWIAIISAETASLCTVSRIRKTFAPTADLAVVAQTALAYTCTCTCARPGTSVSQTPSTTGSRTGPAGGNTSSSTSPGKRMRRPEHFIHPFSVFVPFRNSDCDKSCGNGLDCCYSTLFMSEDVRQTCSRVHAVDRPAAVPFHLQDAPCSRLPAPGLPRGRLLVA